MSRPVRRRRLQTPLAVAVLLIVVAVLLRLSVLEPSGRPAPPSEPLTEGTYEVQRVVDGDTLLLANHTRVRLIGVDTPETKRPDYPVEPFGPEATRFTEEFIGTHRVQLRLDHERLDAHGRLLAYVYVNGKMLNESLLRAGLARRTNFSYMQSMKDLFGKAETEARQNRRGIWSQKR